MADSRLFRTTSQKKWLIGGLLSFVLCAPLPAMTVTLTASIPSPGYVGQMLTWSAVASGTGSVRYRFRVKPPGGDFQMIRDYGPLSSLDWTATDHEGVYQVELSARSVDTGEVATTSQVYQLLSRVIGGQALVNPTAHPLVFLFSAPSCPAGGQMHVEFQTSLGQVHQTPSKNCAPPQSMNFYLAGLYPRTTYSARSVVRDADGGLAAGSAVTFQTGQIPELPWDQTVLQAAPADTDRSVLLGVSGGSQIATDLNGNVIWYNLLNLTWATRFEQGGYIWGVLEDIEQDLPQQGIRKVDLTGMTVLETNAEQVNAQLVAMGRHPISGFHHEVRTLPDGSIVALADVEQVLTDIQGPGPIDVVGDMIIVFDPELRVLWTWDTFDYLDVTRVATGGEICTLNVNGCPPFYLADQVNDWTHGNAVQLTPDGNLLYSARHQDLLFKINYANGTGDGHIIWRLGKDGDFTFLSDDPYPWFSHQHDGNFELSDPGRVAVFDNGNIRVLNASGPVHSRGQVIELDEIGRTATLVLNVDLGVLSLAVGTAQQLSDGDYHFDAGAVLGQNGLTAYAVGVDACGQTESTLEANTLLYRSFRMSDMYTSPEMRKGVRDRPPPYAPPGQARGGC
jgi:arylsulfate sulfotransferase